MIAVLAFAFFAMSFLLLDGGRKLTNLAHAQDLAGETARYASQILDPESVFAGNPVVASSAPDAARIWAEGQGGSAVVVSISADGKSVTVTLTLADASNLTPGFDMTTSATHTAYVLDQAP